MYPKILKTNGYTPFHIALLLSYSWGRDGGVIYDYKAVKEELRQTQYKTKIFPDEVFPDKVTSFSIRRHFVIAANR